MIIFANSGGVTKELDEAIKLFSSFLVPKMNMLYIPFAAYDSDYDENYKAFVKHLSDVSYGILDIVYSASDLAARDMKQYSAIFIDDGSPFKLIRELKNDAAADKLVKAVKNNIPLFAIGAGAVALGSHIEQSEITMNEVGYTDLEGLNLFNGNDIFIYSDKYNTEEYLTECEKLKFAAKKKDRSILALHRNTTLYCINKELYKLDEASPFDYITKKGCVHLPFYGKITYDMFRCI